MTVVVDIGDRGRRSDVAGVAALGLVVVAPDDASRGLRWSYLITNPPPPDPTADDYYTRRQYYWKDSRGRRP